MAKITVIKEPGTKGVPFLKGILVQSLLSAGLSFKDAYAATQAVRKSLENNDTVTTAELKACVITQLEMDFGAKARRKYEAESERKQEIVVTSNRGESRFSTGVLTRSLEACVIERKSALEVAQKVHESVRISGKSEISRHELQRLIYQSLREHGSKKAAKYFLSRLKFKTTGDPLVILLGGATGTGKSTVSSDLAYRLDVLRTQSTDMMREIIRSYLSPRAAPTLGYSSFEAWRGLPGAGIPTGIPRGLRKTDNPVIAGFLDQYANVETALKATIARAVKERHDIIIEGVHVLPAELDLSTTGDAALVVPVMLAVTNKQRLADQLSWRGDEQPDRDSARYLEQLEAIWGLQSFLLNEAEKAHLPIIANWSIEDAVSDVLQEVNLRISERHPPDPGILD